MSKLMLYKLVSGEELVGEVVQTSEHSVEVKNAVTLVYQQMAEGKMSVGFAPFMPYAEGKIEIRNSAIAAAAPPTDQIANEHMRVFSGIVIASAGSKFA